MHSVQTLRVDSLRDDENLRREFRANRARSRERVPRIRCRCAKRGVNGGTAAAATRRMASPRIEPWTIPLLVIMGTTFLVGFIMVIVVVLMR